MEPDGHSIEHNDAASRFNSVQVFVIFKNSFFFIINNAIQNWLKNSKKEKKNNQSSLVCMRMKATSTLNTIISEGEEKK